MEKDECRQKVGGKVMWMQVLLHWSFRTVFISEMSEQELREMQASQQVLLEGQHRQDK